jgi:peptidoglycan/LPS O-acetylase OafA/YrhL
MKSAIERFHSLDLLRGVAALSVVFWHWQHFFYSGTGRNYPLERMPLVDVFFLLYAKGWLAVELFFSLSGFIFFWLYSRAIAQRTVSAREFFLRRFSRLYPLHFATLLAVAAGQLAYLHLVGRYFIYSNNDAYHFGLNLLFISSWGLEKGWSFNAPVWSVSVEVFLYLLFFIVCRLWPARLLGLLAMAALGFLAVKQIYAPLGRGIGGFYLGGCAYLAYEWIVARGHVRFAAITLGCASVALWLVSVLVLRDFLYGTSLPALAPLQQIDGYWPTVILTFPLTILALALVEHWRGTLGRRAALLGDISYSSYMIHFPLQLAFALFAALGSVDSTVFYSPYMLILFFAVLIALSAASHRFFELPLQRWLRSARPLAHELRH